MFRFLIPLGDMASHANGDPYARNLSQKAYISAVGYAELNAVIPQNAVVQFNPKGTGQDRMSVISNMLGIDHETAITSDEGVVVPNSGRSGGMSNYVQRTRHNLQQCFRRTSTHDL